jgi:hypothetical protein
MREWKAPEKADILVSELLGSFGDNEVSFVRTIRPVFSCYVMHSRKTSLETHASCQSQSTCSHCAAFQHPSQIPVFELIR